MHICAGIEGAIVRKLENIPIRLLILSPPFSPACLQVLSTSSTSSFSLPPFRYPRSYYLDCLAMSHVLYLPLPA